MALRCCGLLLAIAASGQPVSGAELKPLEIPVGQSQLFVDDFIVDRSDGLKRTLHHPADVSHNPVIVPEHPWEHRRIPYGSVWYDESERKFRCWYLTLNIYDSRPGFRGYRKRYHIPIQEAACLCYAESDDGIHWCKPELGLHEFRGSKKNNIVLRCPGTHFDSTSVMHTPHDRDRPWKMISFIGLWPYKKDLIEKQWGDTKFGITRHGHYAWSSQDGIHWESMNRDQPVLRVSDRSMFWYDRENKIYVAAAKTSRGGKRAQRYAWSRDAVNWTLTSDWIHAADERDHPGDEGEAAYGFKYAGQYIGFGEMRRIRNGRPVKINWELLSSHDGRKWHRPIRDLFFADGPQESWRYDVFKIFANPPIERDGKLWIYYGGKTGTVSLEDGTEPFQAMCLATLRRDGFVSLDAGIAGGAVITKPFLTVGTQLHLNVNVHDGGEARVEIVDQDGSTIPGFGLADCRPVTADNIDAVVSWEVGADIRRFAGQPVRLRIVVQDAALFSFQFR